MSLQPGASSTEELETTLQAIVARHYSRAQREIYARIPLTLIQICTAHVCGVQPSRLLCHRRHQELIEARHIALFLATDLTSRSLSEIGRAFHRDHSTVVFARDKVSEKMGADAHFADKVAEIRNLISAVHAELRDLAASDTRARSILTAA